MSGRVTLQEVARTAAVSVSTVSRVVNGGPNVRDDVRVRVQETVERLGYRPNVMARSLRRGRDETIGVVVDSLADIFFATFADAVEQVAVARGYAVVIASSGRDPVRERTLVETFLQRQVAGLILVPVGSALPPAPLSSRALPVVLADRTVDVPGVDAVVGDDHAGALAATRHLLTHGHRRIAFLGDDLGIRTSRDRLGGYAAALAEAGIDVDPTLVVTGCTDVADSERVSRELVAAAAPTAVLSSNVRCTTGLVTALHRTGRTDVAVVGFGDFPLADALSPAVTVVDQDPARMGRLCAERIFARLDGTAVEATTTVVDVHLVIRGSGELPCSRS